MSKITVKIDIDRELFKKLQEIKMQQGKSTLEQLINEIARNYVDTQKEKNVQQLEKTKK